MSGKRQILLFKPEVIRSRGRRFWKAQCQECGSFCADEEEQFVRQWAETHARAMCLA